MGCGFNTIITQRKCVQNTLKRKRFLRCSNFNLILFYFISLKATKKIGFFSFHFFFRNANIVNYLFIFSSFTYNLFFGCNFYSFRLHEYYIFDFFLHTFSTFYDNWCTVFCCCCFDVCFASSFNLIMRKNERNKENDSVDCKTHLKWIQLLWDRYSK